ncbi:heme-binding protein 1-like [Limulus polyphemus]|uniref:Heme-binding protein 1-like n=1 Tax=Limulus polyphemus TaxID=6850 RepID=A0ABM1TCJ2_LIMPO|nr:heme-binding protein 1-like [Limulus polyphemus]
MSFLKFIKSAITGSEEPKFEVVNKCDDFEIRSYPETQWLTLKLSGKLPDEFGREDFHRLFGYINGQNESGNILFSYHLVLQLKIQYSIRTFGGFAKDADWKKEFEYLKSKLENPEEADLSSFCRAGFDPPFKPFGRRNEVWVFKTQTVVPDVAE